MKRTTDSSALHWLADRGATQGIVATGIQASGWDASIWILHAMYETDEVPDRLTHDDVYRIERAAGAVDPVVVGDADLEDLLSDATVTGTPLGRSQHPGSAWRRLHWSELARRLDVDPFAAGASLGFRSFPYSSWPANIEPPAEGSLDREQFVSLIDRLASTASAGYESPCTALYAACAVGEFDEPVLYTGVLGELIELYDDEDLPGSPNNLWPRDRSWFVYTDWDLWATQVSGTVDLIDRISAENELETVSLPL